METSQSLFRYARALLAGNALSRVSGMLRDVATAICFGPSAELAAFFIAFRLSNLFRRMLGEGNLQSSFIPQFSSKGEKEGAFFRDTAFSLSTFLIALIVLLEALLYALRPFLRDHWALTANLSMKMLPGLLFICLSSLNAAVLQCKKRYFYSAASPVFFNLVWIVSCCLWNDVHILSWSVTLAFGMQWLVSFIEPRRLLECKHWVRPKFFPPEVKALLGPMSFGLVGVGAVQINSALDPIFASLSDLSGPAYLWYAIRLQQLPFALFGASLFGALISSLSRANEETQRISLLQSAMKQATFWMLFSTFSLFALGSSGLNLLYGRGAFGAAGIENTLYCLWGYGLGLLPSVYTLLLSARYNARGDYRTPARASVISMGVNCVLNALFVFVFKSGAEAIAFATSLSSLVNAALLFRKEFSLSFRFLSEGAGTPIVAAFVVLIVQKLFMEEFTRDPVAQCVQFGTLSALYLAFFARDLKKRLSFGSAVQPAVSHSETEV